MDILNIVMAIISIILGIISIVIAIKSQITSNEINKDTENKLSDIKNISDSINKTADRIESNLKTQIDRIVNSNAPTQDEKLQHDLMTALLPTMIKQPEILAKLMDMGNKSKGE